MQELPTAYTLHRTQTLYYNVIAMKPFVGRGHVLSRVQELPTEYKLVHAYCLPLRGRLGHVPALHWLFRLSWCDIAFGLRAAQRRGNLMQLLPTA